MLAAAAIGNALEWYDILVYGYFAVTIAKLFFPNADPAVSLLSTLGTFGAAYLIRPLGALVLGAYTDRRGRKAAMLLSVVLMTLGTGLSALMPTYATIGVFAPVGMMAARLLQGFAVGGEFGSVTAYLAEQTNHRKGFFASFQWFGQGLAAVFASAFGVGLNSLLTPEQLLDWGWRLPFLFGLLIGPIGLYLRSHMEEAPEFVAAGPPAEAPIRDLIAKQWGRLLIVIGMIVVSTSVNYIILYMPTFAIQHLHLPQWIGFVATLAGGLILAFASPLFGHLSDKIGRVPIMIGVCILFGVTAYPAFAYLVGHPTLATITVMVGWLSILKAAYSGVLPSLMSEMFPVATRGSGLALSYNVSVPIFRRVHAVYRNMAGAADRRSGGTELLPDGGIGREPGGARCGSQGRPGAGTQGRMKPLPGRGVEEDCAEPVLASSDGRGYDLDRAPGAPHTAGHDFRPDIDPTPRRAYAAGAMTLINRD